MRQQSSHLSCVHEHHVLLIEHIQQMTKLTNLSRLHQLKLETNIQLTIAVMTTIDESLSICSAEISRMIDEFP